MITLNYSLGSLKVLDKSTPLALLLLFFFQKPAFVAAANHPSLGLSIKTSPFQPFLSVLTDAAAGPEELLTSV